MACSRSIYIENIKIQYKFDIQHTANATHLQVGLQIGQTRTKYPTPDYLFIGPNI